MTSSGSTPKSARLGHHQPAANAPCLPSAADAIGPDVQALRRFRVIFNAVRSHFQQVEKRTGTGAAQLRALSILRERPGIRLSELAQAMDVHQSTASNLVKTLLEREWISTKQNGSDRRVRHLYLQTAGIKILQRMGGPYIGVLPKALSTLPPCTLQRLNSDLDELIAAMHIDDTAALTPLSEQL